MVALLLYCRSTQGCEKKHVFRHAEPQLFPQKNRWVLLRKTILSQTKTGVSRPDLRICPNLVEFYNQVRTEFEQNGRSAAPTPAGTLRPLAPPEKPFGYFFEISPRRISFVVVRGVFWWWRVTYARCSTIDQR